MVLRSERSLKSKMLSLARTSKYVKDTSVHQKQRRTATIERTRQTGVIVVINLYSCFLIELLCQTKTFMQFERLNRLSEHLHEIG